MEPGGAKWLRDRLERAAARSYGTGDWRRVLKQHPLFIIYTRNWLHEVTGFSKGYLSRMATGNIPLTESFIERVCFKLNQPEEELFLPDKEQIHGDIERMNDKDKERIHSDIERMSDKDIEKSIKDINEGDWSREPYATMQTTLDKVGITFDVLLKWLEGEKFLREHGRKYHPE